MLRFAGHLQALIESLGGEGTLAAGEESGSPRAARRRLSDWAASRLAQFDRAVHLYFDEFQALNNRAALGVFRELLEHLPDNVTIFIGSRSEEHTSELQSLMRISYAVFCLKKKNKYLNYNVRTKIAPQNNKR